MRSIASVALMIELSIGYQPKISLSAISNVVCI